MENFHYSVAIRYHDSEACPAVKQFTAQRSLSDQAPPLGETERFLLSEAPLLPLAECTMAHCQCHYVRYADRRSQDRRTYVYPHWAVLAFMGTERRDRPSRRQTDFASPRQE